MLTRASQELFSKHHACPVVRDTTLLADVLPMLRDATAVALVGENGTFVRAISTRDIVTLLSL